MAIESALKDIQNRFGEGAIMKLGSKPDINIEVIPTGCASVDKALGIGGFPRGRIIELYGEEGTGKSTLSLMTISQAQKLGGICAYIDIEHSCNPEYLKVLGVDIDNLFISQASSGEEALEIVEALVDSGEVSAIVVDSVAALVPLSELQGEMGDAQMGMQARLMSQACRKLTAKVGKSNTCLIFINQLRQKLGVSYGPTEVTTGGRALKFYASIRLKISRIGAVKSGEDIIGNRTKVQIVKNRFAPPYRTCEFDLIYGEGISEEGDVLDTAIKSGLIQKGGAWLTYGNYRWQGKEKARKFLKENPEIYEELKSKC